MGLKEQVLATFAAHKVPLLVGEPGIGKSAFAVDLAHQLGGKAYVVCLSHEEPADVHGFKAVAKHRVTVDGRDLMVVETAPPWYAVEIANSDRPAVLVYDELSCVPAGTQAPVLSILADRVIGGLKMDPTRVAIMACANPVEMAAGGWDLSPPMANRLRHLKFKLDRQEWARQFPVYWGRPPAIGFAGVDVTEAHFATARATVATYIRLNPDALLDVPKAVVDQAGAWPSPRTWEGVARTLAVAAATAGGMDPTDVAALVAGDVGEGHGNTFVHWVATMDLVDAAALLADPQTFALPATEDRQFHLVTTVTAHVAYLASLTREKGGDVKARPLTKAADAARAAAFNVLGRFVRAGGPKDIATLGAIALCDDFHRVHKNDRHRSDPVPATPPEVELFPDVLRAAGVAQGGR